MTDNLSPKVEHILILADIIREVDGSHSLGAAALADDYDADVIEEIKRAFNL